jgi:3-oxoacyl-[acyl-carrier protein] reductase
VKVIRIDPVDFSLKEKLLKLQDKILLVTGAGQGIGRAIAVLAAAEGARVALVERNETTGRETLVQIEALGAEGLLVLRDITLDQAVPEIIEQVLARWQHLDILVNNAGFDRPAGIFKIKDSEWDAVMDVHLKAAMAFIRSAMPVMKEQGYGRIVNLSSIYGKTGGKGEIAYATAKAGLIGLTKSVAKEVGKFGVCVNAVLPGLTATPAIQTMMAEKFKEQILAQTPLGRLAQPEEIAQAVIFLASDEASYITGACLEVSGGWEM